MSLDCLQKLPRSISEELAESRLACALLAQAEYRGRTVWDCQGQNPPHAWTQPSCTAVPPGGLQEKLHLLARTLCPGLRC